MDDVFFFFAKNAIKKTTKKPDWIWAPFLYRDLLASTTTASIAQQSAIGVFSLRGANSVFRWFLGPVLMCRFGCVLPRSPGVWHPFLLQKTWHFYLWNSIKALNALAGFLFPQS